MTARRRPSWRVSGRTCDLCSGSGMTPPLPSIPSISCWGSAAHLREQKCEEPASVHLWESRHPSQASASNKRQRALVLSRQLGGGGGARQNFCVSVTSPGGFGCRSFRIISCTYFQTSAGVTALSQVTTDIWINSPALSSTLRRLKCAPPTPPPEETATT